jgi:hypothetical protein
VSASRLSLLRYSEASKRPNENDLRQPLCGFHSVPGWCLCDAPIIWYFADIDSDEREDGHLCPARQTTSGRASGQDKSKETPCGHREGSLISAMHSSDVSCVARLRSMRGVPGFEQSQGCRRSSGHGHRGTRIWDSGSCSSRYLEQRIEDCLHLGHGVPQPPRSSSFVGFLWLPHTKLVWVFASESFRRLN